MRDNEPGGPINKDGDLVSPRHDRALIHAQTEARAGELVPEHVYLSLGAANVAVTTGAARGQ